MIESGAVAYTKKLRTHVGPKGTCWVEHGVKGFAAVLVIGFLDPGEPSFTRDQLFALIGDIGFANGDDIIECLGQKSFDKLHKFLKGKYGKAFQQPDSSSSGAPGVAP